jgi:hypothetical protein
MDYFEGKKIKDVCAMETKDSKGVIQSIKVPQPIF